MRRLTRAQSKAMREMIARAKDLGNIAKVISKPSWAKTTTINNLVSLGFLKVATVSEQKHYQYSNFGKDLIGCRIHKVIGYQIDVKNVEKYNRQKRQLTSSNKESQMTYLMNPATGSVDTEENWKEDMETWEENAMGESPQQQFDSLVVVEKDADGNWVEAEQEPTPDYPRP
jgi:hypothetical protein